MRSVIIPRATNRLSDYAQQQKRITNTEQKTNKLGAYFYLSRLKKKVTFKAMNYRRDR